MKEEILFEKDLKGWVCTTQKKVFYLKNVYRGSLEIGIDGFRTPLDTDDFKKPEPNIKRRKLHIISLWSHPIYNQGDKVYHDLGGYNIVVRIGKYPSMKIKVQGNNTLVEDQIIIPKNVMFFIPKPETFFLYSLKPPPPPTKIKCTSGIIFAVLIAISIPLSCKMAPT